MVFRKRNMSKTSPKWNGLFDHPPQSNFLRSLDGVILGITIVLTLGGLIAVFSASGYTAQVRYESSTTLFFLRQSMWLAVGYVMLLLLARLDYSALRPFIPRILIGCIGLLVVVLVAGVENNGARRWISLEWFSVQPGELSKLVVVLYLASYLAKPNVRITKWQDGLLEPILVVGFVCALLVFEDFGTPVVLGLVLVGMLFLAGARVVHLSSVAFVVIPPAIWLVANSPERLERLTSFLGPLERSTKFRTSTHSIVYRI